MKSDRLCRNLLFIVEIGVERRRRQHTKKRVVCSKYQRKVFKCKSLSESLKMKAKYQKKKILYQLSK